MKRVPGACTYSNIGSAIPHDGCSTASPAASSKQMYLLYDPPEIDNYHTIDADDDFAEQEFGRKRKMNQKHMGVEWSV